MIGYLSPKSYTHSIAKGSNKHINRNAKIIDMYFFIDILFWDCIHSLSAA